MMNAYVMITSTNKNHPNERQEEMDEATKQRIGGAMYYGYARYEDGTCICHYYGTLQEVEESERRVLEGSKVKVSGFERKEDR